jgi:hypothetical protein
MIQFVFNLNIFLSSFDFIKKIEFLVPSFSLVLTSGELITETLVFCVPLPFFREVCEESLP